MRELRGGGDAGLERGPDGDNERVLGDGRAEVGGEDAGDDGGGGETESER